MSTYIVILQLLIAKANKRQRHERRVRLLKNKIQEEKGKELSEAIMAKLSRAEKFAVELEYRQRQVSWLKLIGIAQYLDRIRAVQNQRSGVIARNRFKDVANFASKIRNHVLKWYYHRIFLKYKVGFLKALKKSEFFFRLTFRIWRKRRAVKRLMFFLNIQSNNRKKMVSN